MAPTRFSIVLDNPIGSYFPGQNVTGKVILVLDQEKNSQGLKLKFSGQAEVAWQESQGQSGSKGYSSNESYFHSKTVLVGDEKNTDVIIPAGCHEYPFTFQLPPNLPSSFESQFGFVRYELEAVVKRSWKFDYSTKLLFTVNALVDLNLHPVYAEPNEVIKEKSICCLCCKQGPITMRVEVQRTGYVSGEFVRFSVYSNNQSSRPVSGIVVYLIREISFRAQGRTKRISEELVKLRGPEVKPYLSETWKDSVQLPAIPPTDLGGCKIMGMTYLLKLKLDIPSSIDLKKKLPLMIGTIPFTNFLHDLPQKGISDNQEIQLPDQSPPFTMPSPIVSQYPNMPVPTFQEAIAFAKAGEDKNDSATPNAQSGAATPLPGDSEYRFTPKYATYNYGWKFHLNIPDQNGLN